MISVTTKGRLRTMVSWPTSGVVCNVNLMENCFPPGLSRHGNDHPTHVRLKISVIVTGFARRADNLLAAFYPVPLGVRHDLSTRLGPRPRDDLETWVVDGLERYQWVKVGIRVLATSDGLKSCCAGRFEIFNSQYLLPG